MYEVGYHHSPVYMLGSVFGIPEKCSDLKQKSPPPLTFPVSQGFWKGFAVPSGLEGVSGSCIQTVSEAARAGGWCCWMLAGSPPQAQGVCGLPHGLVPVGQPVFPWAL